MNILTEKMSNLCIFWAGFFRNASIIIVAITFLCFCLSYDEVAASDTRVAVSVSIGTGIAVGVAGIFLYVNYSSEVTVLEDKGYNSLVLFPDTRPIPSNDFTLVVYPEERREEAFRVYFVGVKW